MIKVYDIFTDYSSTKIFLSIEVLEEDIETVIREKQELENRKQSKSEGLSGFFSSISVSIKNQFK